MTLLIDDLKDLPADVIARTYDAGIAILKNMHITHLKLDHDLGLNSKTGYDVVLILEQEFYANGIGHLPATIELVSYNPIGIKNMTAALERIYPFKKGLKFSKVEL